MKERLTAWIFFVALGVALLWLIVRYQMAKTPISLASVGTSRGSNGCEVVISVDRRDGLIGFSHGAPPTLRHAWLSDGQGKELTSNFLSPLPLAPRDSYLGSWQFGWRVARTIPHPPGTVVFHATFTAPGAGPFHFEQELRGGTDFNYKEEAEKSQPPL